MQGEKPGRFFNKSLGPLTRTLAIRTEKPKQARAAWHRFPPELWHLVFKNIKQKKLTGIRLTCKLFAELSKPQMFSELVYRPYRGSDNTLRYQNHHRWQINEAQSTDFIAFWTSNTFAPLVQRCTISSILQCMAYRHYTDHLLESFFHRLHLFPQLTSLRCEFVPFFDSLLMHISNLRKLKTLELEDCMVTASCAPPQIHVRNVTFKSHSCPRSATPPGDFGWMDIIHPNSIHRIEIDFADPLTCHLRGISSKHTPDLPDEACCVQRHMQLLIAHPTALEELHIAPYSLQPRDREIDMDSFQVNLPMLRAYDGPFQFYEGFLPGEMIELLELRHLVGGYVDTQRVLRTLSKQVHPHIRSLTVRVFDDPIGYLRKISALYPQLRHVGISICQFHEEELLDSLPSALPSSIQTFDLMNHITPKLRGFCFRLRLFRANPYLLRMGDAGQKVWDRPSLFIFNWLACLLLFFSSRNS